MAKLYKTLVLLIAGMTLPIYAAGENDWFKYLGDNKPFQAPPKTISAAEAMPPLPLPATPLRRTERKKPPQPDYLIGKVIWGQSATFDIDNGQSLEVADWNLCPTDLDRLMDNVRRINLDYHWKNISLNNFSFSSAELPALLISGTRSVKLGDVQLESLRNYITSGGTLVFDSIGGSPYFYSSACQLINSILPECQLRDIPHDHPIYHIINDIGKVNIPSDKDLSKPQLQGVYIGSRLGIIISKHGLGCGWNNNTAPLTQLPASSFFDARSATQLGLNLAAYIVGYAQAGYVEGLPEMFSLADQAPTTDEFIFAQIKHQGQWNVHPNAAAALLMKLRKYTAVRVNLQRRTVTLESDNLEKYPFLFLSGMADFSFSDKEIAILQKFLINGGFILINNGMGMNEFDIAVKREFAKITPNSQFKPIPTDHQLFSAFYPISKTKFSPAAIAAKPQLNDKPALTGININGELRIIYSPYDLEAGWLPAQYPLIKGYQQQSAVELGVNIITYIMTS